MSPFFSALILASASASVAMHVLANLGSLR